MSDNEKLVRQIDKLKQLTESVDFGDLKNELGNNREAVGKIERLEKALGSVDFGDLKNELKKGKKSGN